MYTRYCGEVTISGHSTGVGWIVAIGVEEQTAASSALTQSEGMAK